jgi:hypothetical protein
MASFLFHRLHHIFRPLCRQQRAGLISARLLEKLETAWAAARVLLKIPEAFFTSGRD